MPVSGSELDYTAPGDAHVLGCGCPVCAGTATVGDDAAALAATDAELTGPQAYLNADERAGIGSNGKDSYTVAEAANQIVRGDPGWSSALGRPFTVSYGFRASEPTTMPDDATGFSRFNATQITQAELALRAWSDVANISFTRVGAGTSGEAAYSNNAAILFANYADGVEGASAFAMFPGSTSPSSRAGDVWINNSISYNANPVAGGYGAMVLLHELGHAIGLAHPAAYNAGDDATISYGADAIYYEDSRQYTVMSYFSESNTGGNFAGRYAASPLLDDIAAAQLEYGANMTTRTGNTVYGFNATADRPWYTADSSSARLIFAVWDAGGRDTLDFSGYSNSQLIDLREGFFSNVGGLTGNVAVGMGAVIEDARGGFGSDRINGNAVGNSLLGGAGSDTIEGSAGLDYLRGEDGNDSLSGGADFDDMHGNMGNDTLRGGLGDDWVVGGKDQDLLYGDEGADIVYGNLGNDTCEGGAGADLVRGGQGDDVLRAGDGNDWLSGDLGDDTLAGGAGADIFHTFGLAGVDRVTDFSLAEGDRVQLDLGTTWSLAQVGPDTVVSMAGGGWMVLQNVSLGSLTPGWIFVV